jgi:hypothetical protein
VIRAAYTQIAQDEQRHAELAFQFVRWALTQNGDSVRGRIQAALQAPELSQHAAREVTLPCLAALLTTGPTSTHQVVA